MPFRSSPLYIRIPNYHHMKCLLASLVTGIMILMLCLCGCTTQPAQPPATTAPVTATPVPQVQTTVPPVAGQAALTGVTWYLIAFNQGGSSLSILPGTEITAFFDAQGKVSGSAGCNQYSASYQATLNNLFIGTPATTRMACNSPAGIMTQETTYLTTIQGASTFTIENDILTIKDSNGQAILTYSKVPPGMLTPAPLTGTTWYVTSLVDSGGQIWTPVPAYPISLEFAADGSLNGKSGCNNYFGSYNVSGSTISIGTLGTTLMYCGEAGVMDRETIYLSVLPQMKVYRISGDALTLSDGAGKITMLYSTNPL
jgi:heat shock protein HslJ